MNRLIAQSQDPSRVPHVGSEWAFYYKIQEFGDPSQFSFYEIYKVILPPDCISSGKCCIVLLDLRLPLRLVPYRVPSENLRFFSRPLFAKKTTQPNSHKMVNHELCGDIEGAVGVMEVMMTMIMIMIILRM